MLTKIIKTMKKNNSSYGWPKVENCTFHPQDIKRVKLSHEFFLRHLLDRDFTTVDLARDACMSETKYKRIFRYVFKTSAFKYYQELRLQYAFNLIVRDKLHVKEVATILSYHNPQKLSLALRKYFEVSIPELKAMSAISKCAEPFPYKKEEKKIKHIKKRMNVQTN